MSQSFVLSQDARNDRVFLVNAVLMEAEALVPIRIVTNVPVQEAIASNMGEVCGANYPTAIKQLNQEDYAMPIGKQTQFWTRNHDPNPQLSF